MASQWLRFPLEVPTRATGLLWALPICVSIAMVYKALRLETFKGRLFIREVLVLSATIGGFLALVAAGLWGISRLANL